MPDWKPEIRERLSSVRLAPAREAEIVEELSQHLEDRFRELVTAGATADEAERKARDEFSAEDVLAPYLSALRRAHWADPAPPAASRAFSLHGLGADLRQSWRGLRSSPSFTAAALLVLTLGIGATTAIFAVVDTVVLRGLPFDDDDRIVAVGERIAMEKGRKGPFVMPGTAPPTDPQALSQIEPQNYLDWIARQQVFESMAAIDAYGENTLLLPGAPPEAIVRSRVTAGFFDVLKARAAIGRVFTAAFEDIVTRLRHVPGIVEASAAAPGIPLRVNMHIDGLTVSGKVLDGDTSVSLKSVSPAYHRVLKIPLRSGRLFEATDQTNSAPVTILSEAAARVFFRDEDPVGRRVVLAGGERTVIGVVGNARQGSLEINPHPEVYLPMTQSSNRSGYLVIRTSGNPDDVLPDVRAVVSAVLPHDPLRYIASMEELIARQTATRRLNMVMLSLFGALGLAISTIGVFGVLAHLVTQRTREIGVRMALGATRGQIIQMVLRNAMALVLAGIVVGGAAGWYLSTVAKQFLFGLDPHDARPFVLSAIALVVAAVLASYLPARRAASVDPTVALRSE